MVFELSQRLSVPCSPKLPSWANSKRSPSRTVMKRFCDAFGMSKMSSTSKLSWANPIARDISSNWFSWESRTTCSRWIQIQSITFTFALPAGLKKLTLGCRLHPNPFLRRLLVDFCPSLEYLSLTNLSDPLAEEAHLRFLKVLMSSSLTTLTLNVPQDAFEMARKALMENKALHLPSLKVVRSLSGLKILELFMLPKSPSENA